MDQGSIYLLQQGSDGSLIEMKETSYEAETLLQRLLVDYPKLLAGEQMDSDAPRRWLLVRREMPVPSEEEGAGRWSLDHLFLDQEGVPTLVEVKRSSDTRIRREVVGQMLDYAANAVVHWPLERIRTEFGYTCESREEDPSEVLAEFLEEGDADRFWEVVKTNLQAERIRMLFVADVIPTELRRVVEFLNLQMNPAEVLALEVKQYIGQGVQTLVPRIVGQTVAAQQKRSSAPTRPGKKWDEGSFFEAMYSEGREREAEVARRLLDWAIERGLNIWWGEGAMAGSFYPMYLGKDKHFTFSVWSNGGLEIQFQYMKSRSLFEEESPRLELLRSLNAITGLDIPEQRISGRPKVPLTALKEDTDIEHFLRVFDAYLTGIQVAEADARAE